jgi:hypothetical protein
LSTSLSEQEVKPYATIALCTLVDHIKTFGNITAENVQKKVVEVLEK